MDTKCYNRCIVVRISSTRIYNCFRLVTIRLMGC